MASLAPKPVNQQSNVIQFPHNDQGIIDRAVKQHLAEDVTDCQRIPGGFAISTKTGVVMAYLLFVRDPEVA